jgi:hypothetical protein
MRLTGVVAHSFPHHPSLSDGWSCLTGVSRGIFSESITAFSGVVVGICPPFPLPGLACLGGGLILRPHRLERALDEGAITIITTITADGVEGEVNNKARSRWRASVVQLKISDVMSAVDGDALG